MSNLLRYLLACAFALGIGLSIGDLFTGIYSAVDVDLNATTTADVFKATSLVGLQTRGDVQIGDELAALKVSVPLRMASLAYPASVTFLDKRTNRLVELSDDNDAKRPVPFKIRMLVRVLVECSALALLLARGRQRGVVALCIFLFFSQYAAEAESGRLLGVWAVIFYQIIQQTLTFISEVALIVFAAGLAPSNRSTRITALLSYVAASTIALLDFVMEISQAATGLSWDDFAVCEDVQAALSCVALVLFASAARSASGSGRRRIVLLGVATLIGSSVNIYSVFGASRVYDEFVNDVAIACTIVMATGLIYAIVVERLFDIAFVINRAVVYGATSAFVILSFVAIEWVVGWTASSFGHLDSAALQLGLAIVVALSLRPIHGRVDAFVDNAIFAARHRSANALRRFADDCGEFRSESALLAATHQALHAFARVSACGIFLADERGDFFAKISDAPFSEPWSGDDGALVRMRTSRGAVFRGDDSQLSLADVAFPMWRRRALIGAIVCNLPERAEPYSPEECEALTIVAREVGTSLVALEALAAQRLTAEIAELRARLAVEGLR